ncbi:UDP-N-acetylmuramoyl-tripeptide--D-alanyl-D-alanine ligase [Thomasclavelia sp.]
MKIKEIVAATNGILISGDENFEVAGFSQDSRNVKAGMMYIPLIGERFDGHDFINDAFENGASAIITDRDIKKSNKIIIKVKDTLMALQDMARYLRKHRNIKVVGITGSVGKTSTRDMIYSVVKQGYQALKTEGNYNNNIGLPLTILRLKDEEVMILEMGMNHLKEMEELSLIAHPDISAITNVGTAHIGELGNRENILKAKLEIIAGMEKGSTLIINNDNDMLSSVNLDDLEIFKVAIDNDGKLKAKDVVLKDDKSIFNLCYLDEEYKVVVPVPGKHFVLNALIAIAVGIKLSISIDKCIQGINEFQLTKKRMDVIELKNNITLIDGTYNASEDSMKSSLDVLATYSKRKIAVLADMLELGEFSEQLHRNVGKYAANKKIDVLVTVGNEAKYIVAGAKDSGMDNIYYCNDNEEVINYLRNNLCSNDVVLLKGSNGMKLKDVVTQLKEKFS